MSKSFELLRKADQLRRQHNPVRTEPLVAGLESQLERRDPDDQAIIEARSPAAVLDSETRQGLMGLVSRLFLFPAPTPLRAVMFCGLDEESGSGWIAACSAELLAAHTPAHVAIVDANFRCPRVHEHFALAGNPGLSDAVQDKSYLQRCAARVSKNLWVVPSGSDPSILEQSLHAGSMRAEIGGLSKQFDCVLLAGTAIDIGNSAALIGTGVDGVVLVLRARVTRRDAAHRAKTNMEGAGVRLLGAILNEQ